MMLRRAETRSVFLLGPCIDTGFAVVNPYTLLPRGVTQVGMQLGSPPWLRRCTLLSRLGYCWCMCMSILTLLTWDACARAATNGRVRCPLPPQPSLLPGIQLGTPCMLLIPSL
jgi:hypothetical protein